MKQSRRFEDDPVPSTRDAGRRARRRRADAGVLPHCVATLRDLGGNARTSALLALLLSIALPAGPSLAESDAEAAAREQADLLRQLRELENMSDDELAEEMARQDALMRGMDETSGPSAQPYELGDDDLARLAPDAGDPRTAPHAPEPRDLPADIFETEEVVIPKGKWSNDRDLKLEQRMLDADGDGKPELVRWHSLGNGELVREHEDSNYDGVTDTWTDYERGQVTGRVRDTNDDGTPDTWERYAEGRLLESQVDRDDDGVRDAFFRYEGRYLAEEKHDADNDGQIDLRIVYERKYRAQVEEDHDRDGRFDSWTFYTVVDGRELVGRVELDRNDRGFADTFEFFEADGEEVRLVRREEDLNGDGQIDLVSFYRGGKLVRRDIAVPELVNL